MAQDPDLTRARARARGLRCSALQHATEELPTLARDVVERGYAIVPDLLDAQALAEVRGAVERLVERIAPPHLYAAGAEPIERPDLPVPLVITPTGLTITGLLSVLPELAPSLLTSRLLDPLRALLGADMRLELVGAAISDRTRPFFGWHTHIDGEEEWTRLERRAWPAKDEVERVIVVVYLDDLDDDGGPLLVLPRRVGDPTPPPHDTLATEWPGHVELRPSAGTAVVLEQCTWHAARSLRREGHRIFVGGYFASARAPRPGYADASLDALLR